MAAHQCPRCPLRFSFRTEVESHLATDHRPKRPVQRTGAAPNPADRKPAGARTSAAP